MPSARDISRCRSRAVHSHHLDDTAGVTFASDQGKTINQRICVLDASQHNRKQSRSLSPGSPVAEFDSAANGILPPAAAPVAEGRDIRGTWRGK